MGVSVGGWLPAALKENFFAFSASTGVCFIAATGITDAPRGHGLHLDSNSVCEHASPMPLWVKQVDHRKRRRRALEKERSRSLRNCAIMQLVRPCQRKTKTEERTGG